MSIGSLILASCYYPLLFGLLPILCWDGLKALKKCGLPPSKSRINQCQHIQSNVWLLSNEAGKTIIAKEINTFRCRWFVIMTFKTVPLQDELILIFAYDVIPEQFYSLLLSSTWNK